MTRVASWVPAATVIRVAASLCVAFMSCLGCPSRSCSARSMGRDSVLSWRGVTFWVPGALGADRLPLPLFFPLSPFPLFSGGGEAPLRRSGVVEAGGSCRAAERRAWSEEKVANRREGPLVGSFFVKGARLASRACRLRVPLLAASGGGLVAVVVTTLSSRRFQVFLTSASSGFRSVSSRFRGSVLGCQSVVAPACVASRPGGVCAERCFRFVPDSVGSPPYFLQLGARRRGSSVSDGLRRRLWRRVVVSSSESERCCSCCCAACVVSVVARRAHAVAARLVLDSLAVVFLVWRTLASQSSLALTGCELCLRCIAWMPCVLVEVSQNYLLLSWFFLGSPFVASGGGSSQECFVFVSGHRCVALVVRSVSFGWAAF
ncbi:hypothetical protein Taro_016718 [Colocasia esculenta]|uniref:Uncharacterized protein n=1 Tax=Colocasia esculenta TaxID=4460 RepID=A0A843UL30_COLES|nr:hypothetical protein [Colocasia esculenta]